MTETGQTAAGGPAAGGIAQAYRGSSRKVNEIRWRKSTYSSGNGGNCVEAANVGPVVAVRDSRDPDGPRLAFRRPAWAAFAAKPKAQA